ncbi:hypothetical protein HDU82_007128 [Entophlyctis luteolus]|nr:hypothetical protein HDU82_007128 [Entophlyctis luteolus]
MGTETADRAGSVTTSDLVTFMWFSGCDNDTKQTNIPTVAGNTSIFNSELVMTLTQSEVTSQVSSHSQLQYGTISANITHSSAAGVVAFFNLKNQVTGDEIDWEWDGLSSSSIVNTIMWHNGVNQLQTSTGTQSLTNSEQIPNGESHIYEISWTPQMITFSIDARIVRTIEKENTSYVVTNTGQSAFFYPDTAMNVNLGTWSAKGAAWAGGPTNWTMYPNGVPFLVHSLQISCYPGTETADGANIAAGPIAGIVFASVAITSAFGFFWWRFRRPVSRDDKRNEIQPFVQSAEATTGRAPLSRQMIQPPNNTVLPSDTKPRNHVVQVEAAILPILPAQDINRIPTITKNTKYGIFDAIKNQEDSELDLPVGDPKFWSSEEVQRFMLCNGVSDSNVAAMKAQDIDGRVIILLEANTLVQRLQLEPFGQVAKFQDAVAQIKQLAFEANNWSGTTFGPLDAPPPAYQNNFR